VETTQSGDRILKSILRLVQPAIIVVDLHHFNPDPDPSCHFDVDPDSTFHLDVNLDPTFNFDAETVVDPGCH